MDAKIVETKGKKLVLECLVCGKHFEKFCSTVGQGGGRYCSRKCIGKSKSLFYSGNKHWAFGKELNTDHLKAISASRKGKHFAPMTDFDCAKCGTTVKILVSEYEARKKTGGKYPKFCSKICSNQTTALSGKDNPRWTRIKCKCQFCNKEFDEKLSRIADDRGKFCSQSCLAKSKTGSRNGSWKGGISNNPYPPEFNHELREQIRKRDNYECQI